MDTSISCGPEIRTAFSDRGSKSHCGSELKGSYFVFLAFFVCVFRVVSRNLSFLFFSTWWLVYCCCCCTTTLFKKNGPQPPEAFSLQPERGGYSSSGAVATRVFLAPARAPEQVPFLDTSFKCLLPSLGVNFFHFSWKFEGLFLYSKSSSVRAASVCSVMCLTRPSVTCSAQESC